MAATWKKACRLLSIGLVLLLPPLIWLQGLASSWVVVLLLAIGSCQLLGARTYFNLAQGLLALGVALFVLLGSREVTLYYPALVNAVLLGLWAYSWQNPPTVIERLAPPAHVAVPRKRRYMRGLTLAWCGVFAINLVLALVTVALPDLKWWVAWNGFGAYLFVGSFAAGEYVFRKRRLERTVDPGASL